MLLVNNSSNPLAHGPHKLPRGEKRDIPDEIAKQWLTIRGVERFISVAEVNKATKDAEKKIESLETENTKLKEELAKLKKAQANSNQATKDAEKKIESLETENTKLKEELAKLKKAQANSNQATKDAEKINPKTK